MDRVNWWLAEVGDYGYAHTLIDGPHSDREGVERALEVFRIMRLERGRKFCCVRLEETEIQGPE
jgi:hypothetical protein